MKLIIMVLLMQSEVYASQMQVGDDKNVFSSVSQGNFDSKKAKELLQKSRKLWKEGELEQAISKIFEAQILAPRDIIISKSSTAMQKQKEMIDSKLQKTVDSIGTGKFKEANKLLSSAGLISNKYSLYNAVKNKLMTAKNEKSFNKKTKQFSEEIQQDKTRLQKLPLSMVLELLTHFRLEWNDPYNLDTF